ncbi:MAG TPA: TlpA disulfide reductase family protein [Phycisphaerales bacterium]|nr:TlpA disulfide reductase family protein [Phycisphaerales bacterium]
MRTLALTALVLVSAAGLAYGQGTVTMKLKSEGVSKELGYYSPVRVDLSKEKPAEIKKLPEGVTAPMFGKLPLTVKGERAFFVVVDEPAGQPAKLYIDSNGNGDLTDDPKVEWTGKESKGEDEKTYTMYSGGGMIEAAPDYKLRLSMYRFDPSDTKRAALADKLLFYRDYATEGEVKLADKAYKAMLVDDRAGGDFTAKGTKIAIDVNGNGKWERTETFDTSKPFKVDGTIWEVADVSKDGLSFAVKKSEKVMEAAVEEKTVDLSPGKQAIAFEATLLDGKKVKFPDDYKGKIVLVDFWATWCPPCIKEMPNVVAAYEQFHDRGFAVLGVSLDRPNAEQKIADKAKELKMPWPHVYDGGYWDARVAKMYGVQSIPKAVLVDGTTGKIIATGGDLKGKKLAETIEKALTEKGRS